MKVRVSIILGMILSFWSGVVYATTFTVTNNLNEGAGSLRWAIEQSNAEEGNSKIVFDLAAPSDTITLTELITVSSSVELDGTIAGGKVTIQGPEIETLIHCVGVPTGGNFSLTSVNFGKWKSRTTTGNNIAVMLDQIKEGGSANFSMNDVSVSGNAKSTTFVNAIDTAWFVSVDKCEIESVNAGVYYGNRAVITNSVFRNCHSTVTSSASRENILVEGCEFYGGNRTTISARYAEVLNCTFDGSAYGVYVMRPHCNVHVDACLFLRTQLHAIYSFNTSEDWHIEVENCEFYDNKRWICFMKRGYSEDFIPAPSRVLFHHNYCGITKEGEPRPNGGGVWAQIDYVDIHDNIFATDGSFHMIRDEGNDTLYVRNNYFGTNAKGVKIGGARAIYSTYIDDQVKEYMAPGRQEYKYYEDNVFYGIEDFGFKTDSIKSYVTLSRNLFIDMPDTAIIDVQKKQIPVISSAEVVEDKLIVTGVSGANSVVEIFRSSQAEQSALEYLTAVESDAEGAFTATIPIEKFGENPICLSATATYADRATSALSKVYCCEGCLLRLDRTEYYVKTSRQGKGDGSSWENAMDGKDFAFVLPQVGDGVTFYVAEGEYDLKKLSTSTDGTPTVYINSQVTIIGGYPANAEEGAVSSPATHHTWMKTGYFRLATGGDVIFDGLRFESTYTRGVFDTYSYGKPNLKVTLKNSVAIGGKEGGNYNTVYACGERLILENDTIYGTYSEYDCVFVHGGCSLDAKNTVMVDAKRSGVYSQASNVSLDSCVISGNKECGIYTIDGNVLSLKNCIVGLSTDARSKKGNGVGINSSSAYVFLENNVIAGNEKEGIKITNGNTRIELLAGNYIGTNKDFENLGNGLDGLYLGGGTVTFPSTLDSANYIGFNGKNGIYTNGRASLNISCNYIGITAAGNLMPNEEYGVYFYSNATSNTFKNVFGYNKQGALFFTNFGTFPQFISENLFFGTEGNAIDLNGVTYRVFTPRISKIERVLDSIYIEGTTDTTFVSDIELFYTNGESQTAHKFLGRKSTTKQGEFSFVIPVETLPKNGNVCFSATATYNGQTGELTDPFCCDSCLCPTDTTLATDTIVVGEKFLDKVYAIGRHDSIFEIIALPNGCDSVVMHTLIVKPDPKVLNYYVKTERWGAGDGSTWENAMNGDDFIFMLPQVGDGVTFHVAEGRYVKEGNALSNKINSSVKIIGGYEAEAKTGAVSDPKKYHTVFESLPEKYGYGFSNLCFYELTNTESVVELSNLDLSHSGVKGKAGKLVVDSCSFYDCYLTLDISVDTLIVSSSYFGKILEEARLYNGINHIRQQGKFASISACTFEGNSSSSLGIRMIDISASGAAHIENCTFANLYNRSTGYQITLASSNDTAFFVNNTVVGNIHQSSFSFTNVAFIGNIIAGSSSSLKDGKILKSEYNLVGEGSSLSNSDKDVNSSDLVEILNGTYDASTGLFTPVLADNGGFTPTVALKSDRLPDGTSIRFPLSETIVATDQRGVERFPLTCMGAYELAYDTSDCEIGTIIFKEDFGGNYRRDPDFGPALPDGLTTLEYGDNLVPYNGYSLRKEALKRNITNCSDFSNVNKHIYCGWYADFDDHTSEGDFDRGYFMQIDMDRNKTIFYTITINDLCEHTHLNLMMWVHPVNSKADSELILSVEDLSGNVLASEAFVVESSVNEWSKISIPFTVPLNQTSIVYKIYSEADSYGGDIAIDDIEVRLCKPAVSVNAPEDYLCATSDYKLTATYGNKGGYIEPVNYTWFKNSELSYEIEGWTKVSEGKELQLENISSDAYYRCVISSAGVEGVFDKCNSASDIIPVLLGGLNDTSFVADTILTGEIYNGNQYFEVGTFDGIVETIHRDGTCDSIVLHELHVVREDFCALATLSSNPITKSSDYLQFTSSYPRDLKFTIMDKEGNIVCKTVERTYGAGEHKVSLFKLFGIDKRDFDPLTPYILVVSSGNDLFMTYIYISWM